MKSLSALGARGTLALLFAMALCDAACSGNSMMSKADGACINKAKIDHDAMCMQVYDPVCGCNNKTYGNACEAGKDGVARWAKGECKTKHTAAKAKSANSKL